MLGTQVNGYTEINNYTSTDGAFPPSGTPTYAGDSFTNIVNCTFEGLNVNRTWAEATEVKALKAAGRVRVPCTPALEIDNGVGYNVVFVQSASPLPSG